MAAQEAQDAHGTPRASSSDPERGLGKESESPHTNSTPALDLPEQIAQVLRFDGYHGAVQFWDRLRGKDRNVPGWLASVKNVVLSSCEWSASAPRLGS